MGLSQIRKIAGYACAGNAGNVSPPPTSKETANVCNPGMHHGTCVTHVPWCMSGSLTRGVGGNVPAILGACATHNFAYLVWGPWEKRGEGFAGLFLCLTLNSIQIQCAASVKYTYKKSLSKLHSDIMAIIKTLLYVCWLVFRLFLWKNFDPNLCWESF